MKLKSILFGAMAVLALASCNKDPKESGSISLSLDKSTVELGYAETKTPEIVNLTTTLPWKIKNYTSEIQSWLTVTPTDGSGNAAISISATANPGSARQAVLTIYVNKANTIALTVKQEGNADKTIEEFLALKDTSSKYTLAGIIGDIATSQKYYGFTLKDNTGTLNCPFPANWTSFSSLLHTGDSVSISGKYAYYAEKSQDQMEKGEIKSHKSASVESIQSKTVAEFISAADKFSRYRLKGIVNSAVDATYCSFDLKDATGSIKAYTINNKAEWLGKIAQGDTVTLRGAYALYGTTTHEVIDADIEEVRSVPAKPIESISIAELIKKADGSKQYRIKGSVSSQPDTYGTFNVADSTGTICVFRPSNWSAKKDSVKLSSVVTLVGTYQLYNTTHELTKATIEKVEEGEPVVATEKTVDEALNAEEGAVVKVYGRIIKKVKNGFILNDGTSNSILIYTTATVSQAEDDIVAVTGSIAKYGTCTEIKPTEDIVSSTKSIPATPELTATALTPAEVASYTGKAANLVSIVGTLTVSGNYYNVALEGQTIQGSLQVSDGAVTGVTAMNGKRVKCTGFYAGNSAKYFLITITDASDVVEDTTPFFAVSPDSLNVSGDGGSAKFNIEVLSTQTWTVASSDTAFVVSPASGTGPAEITVTASKNDSSFVRRANITVSTAGFTDKVVVVKQSKASKGDVKYLTNDEIVAAVFAQTNGYQKFDITSSSGTWKSYSYTSKSSGATKTSTPYIQINSKNGYCLMSPTFTNDIVKIIVTFDATTVASRVIYAVPTNTSLPSSKSYSSTEWAKAYGSCTQPSAAQNSVEIEFNGSTKDFMIIAGSGAVYINSITVYLAE